MEILKGVSSKGFFEKITDSKVVKKEPLVLTLNFPIKTLDKIQPIMDYCKQKDKPLVIFCHQIEE